MLGEIQPAVFRGALATLADNIPDYFARIGAAGFRCSHVNEDWISRRCSIEDVDQHRRYVVEHAREVLSTGNAMPEAGDDQSCKSGWLNELKGQRLARYGRYDDLWLRRETRHLDQLSPALREFVRVRESSSRVDQKDVADQVTEFIGRRAHEISQHRESIAACVRLLPQRRNELSLQAFLGEYLTQTFTGVGARAAETLRRNQAIQQDERIVAVVFDVVSDWLFVLLPSVTLSSSSEAGEFAGTLSVAFRLMKLEALNAPSYEFGRDIIVHLTELLPGKFAGYGRFDGAQDFCLNVVAWATALKIILPDALDAMTRAVA